MGEFMDYEILVNKDNTLDKTYVPKDLVNANSMYKKDILVNKVALNSFMLMKEDAKKLNYNIDIMSGYRDYFYQEKIYNSLLNEKGLGYTLRSVAKAGCSEHQTGLAIDICVYRDNKCYVEHDIEDMEETIRPDSWSHGREETIELQRLCRTLQQPRRRQGRSSCHRTQSRFSSDSLPPHSP